MLSLLRLERQQKDFFIFFIFQTCTYFYFNFLIHLELKRRIDSYTPPNFGPKGANFQTKMAQKPYRMGRVHTYKE